MTPLGITKVTDIKSRDANNTENHVKKQDAETRRHSDSLNETKLVVEDDIPKEIMDEYPPG
jgi:hypothetical protein